jgi:hypothetical protein
MDDRLSSLPLTIKSRPGSVRDISDATTPQRKFSHHTAQSADKPKPIFPSPPWQEAQVKPDRTKEIKMKLRLSIWTMLIAGSLLSAPTTRAGTDSIEECAPRKTNRSKPQDEALRGRG